MRPSVKTIVLVVLIGAAPLLQAQEPESDARLWLYLKASAKVSDKLTAELTWQNRFYENMSQYSRRYICAAVEYKLFKQLRLLAGYAYGGARRPDATYTNAHQVWGGFQARYKQGRVSAIYRNLLQLNMEDIYSSEFGSQPRFFERNKITLKYAINKRLEAFTGSEANTPLYRTAELPVRRLRVFAGLSYAFNKHNAVEGAFVFQKNYRYSNPATRDFIYAVTYAYAF